MNQKRIFHRFVPFTICLIFLGLSGCGNSETPDRPPNILFLMADDHRADAFGFMGNEHVLTPHLDKLARQGVAFQNAYHVVPICLPSRTSVMTGQYLGTHGSGFDRPTHYVLTEEEFRSSYPVLLREAGYFTGFIGKFGFAVKAGEKIPNSNYQNQMEYMPAAHFDVWNGFPGQGSYRPRKGQFNTYPNRWDATHLTAFMGLQARDFLRKAKETHQPFCLSVSFKAPHAPFDPAEAFRQKYDEALIPRMQNDAPAYHERLPEVVREKSRNARWYFGRTKDYYGNELEYRQDWHIQQDSIYQSFIKNYYALITGIDHTVGRIRHELEKLGMADNTIIIYTSDNGFFTGSKQLMGKALLYEESARAPMILYDPRQPEKEEMVLKPGLISHVDIAPTLLDLAGIAIPESYPGASFMPLVRGDRGMIHEAVFGENNYDGNYPLAPETDDPEEYRSIRSQFVRTAGFKYIRYHENQPVVEELYRINEDPLEAHNLIHDPAYADTVEAMRARIADFERKYVKYKNGEPAEATPGEVDEDTKGRRSPSGK